MTAMSGRIDEDQRVKLLVDDLFQAVEKHQGYFHVSDGETFPSAADLFQRVRGRLEHGKAAVRAMENFLRKHGQHFAR